MLLRYHYYQPAGGRYHYASESATDTPVFSLVYSGSIPAPAGEETEEVLERLWLRHSSEMRPQGRGVRPVGTGDVLDLGERGIWQVVSLGFRALGADQLRVEAAA
jgi:hypothetical protein